MYLCFSYTNSNGSCWDRFFNIASSTPKKPPPPPTSSSTDQFCYASPSTLLPGLTAFEVLWGNIFLLYWFLGRREQKDLTCGSEPLVHTVDNGTMCMTGKMGSDRWEHEPTEESVIILSLAHFHSSYGASSLSLSHTFPLHVGQCLVFRNLICPG